MTNIPVIILAGGFGTRLKEETEFKPKPLVEIGGIPMIHHIMKIYSHYGFNDFIVALGYKGDMIKKYFMDYARLKNDIVVHTLGGSVEILTDNYDDFKVTLVDTGLHTLTAERIKKVQKYIGHNRFMVTYGDGVADIDIAKLVKFHRAHGKIATVTGVRPSSRFGELDVKGNRVISFLEKPQVKDSYINGGFFVFEPEFFEYLENGVMLERAPLENVSTDRNLMIFKHAKFWKCMDTHKDYKQLNELWEKGAPWKVW